MQDLKQLAFVGVDIHKDQHTACLTDCFSRNLATFDIPNDPNYFPELTNRINAISGENGLKPVFGLEDTRYFGQRLAQFLISTGNYVKEIPAFKTERKRSQSAHRDKSDPGDALAIAKVLIQDFDKLQTVDTFDELHLTLRVLVNQRGALIKEQTKIKNRLHLIIHRQYPRYEKMFKYPFTKSAVAFWERFSHPSYLKGITVKSLAHFLKLHSNHTVSTKAAQRILSIVSSDTPACESELVRAKVLQSLIRHLRFLQNEIELAEQELKTFVPKAGLKLETLTGVDTVVAAKLISYIGNINRFSSSDKLAKCAGIAPTNKSSGKRTRYRKSKGGHRQLNATIYYIALTQVSKNRVGAPLNLKAREYYLKKIAEGKSKKEALTCLMRRLCDIIYAMMKNKTEYRIS